VRHVFTGAVYETRTYGSVRGLGREPHPTRCLPGKAGKPGGLKEARAALTEGKAIRMASASLATVGCKGSHRKLRVHSESEPDSAGRVVKRAL
jgi:hypothetical protein